MTMVFPLNPFIFSLTHLSLGMYINVQWFSLMLKIDIYFEFMSYTLWFGYLAGNSENWTGESSDTPTLYILLLFMVLLIPSYVMARIAISREIHLLVVIFIFSQILFFVCTILLMVHYSVLVEIWYAFTGYCKYTFHYYLILQK